MALRDRIADSPMRKVYIGWFIGSTLAVLLLPPAGTSFACANLFAGGGLWWLYFLTEEK